MNVTEIANAWFDADNAEKKAYLLLGEALDKELPRACVRVNQRNLVPFTIETIGWNIVTVGSERILKINAGLLKSRETGQNLLTGVFSNSDERKLKEILLPAFTEELGVNDVFIQNFFLHGYYWGKSDSAE